MSHVSRLGMLLACGAAASLVLVPSTDVQAKKKRGSASKELKAELEPTITSLTTSEDAEAKQGALMSWGIIIDRKAMSDLEAFKSNEDPQVRLGAGMGLMLAKAKKSEEFVAAELGAQGELYLKLRDRVSVLPDGVEWKLLDELLDKKDPSTTRDVMKYLAMQEGELFDRLVKMASNKKDGDMRKASLEALVYASTQRQGLMDTAKKLAKQKDVAQRQAAFQIFQNQTQYDSLKSTSLDAIVSMSQSDKDDALKLAATKYLLSSHHLAAFPDALKLASTTEDAALRALIVKSAHDAMADGYTPKYGDIAPLVELKLTGPVQVQVAQLAAASGDASYKEQLLKYFQSNIFEERLLAAQAMGYTKDEAMVQLLAGSLFEGDRRIRLYSAQGLGKLGKESAVKALQQSLSKERDPAVTLAVIDALGYIPSDQSARILRMQTTKRDPKVKEHVVLAYMNHKDAKNIKALELLLRDREERVRWLAFLTTFELDEKQGENLFASILRDPPSTWASDMKLLSDARQDKMIAYLVKHKSRTVQAGALGFALKHPERFKDLLQELLLDESYKESARMTILANLAEHHGKTSQALIERIAGSETKSPRLAHMAAWYLVRDTTPSVEATLRGMMSKEDPVLKAVAIYGLLTMKK